MIRLTILVCAILSLNAVEYGNEILIPLNGVKVYLSVKAKGGLAVTKKAGPDFNVFYLSSDDKDMPWVVSVYDGAHPKEYADAKVGQFKFMIDNREIVGQSYRNNDGVVFGVAREKYNANDLVQFYIVFGDEKSVEDKLKSIPQFGIVKN